MRADGRHGGGAAAGRASGLLLAFGALAALWLGACVTVTSKPTGRFGAPTTDPGFPQRPAPSQRGASETTPSSRAMAGPSTVSSRVRFAVKPLSGGRVPYDGLVPPLVSPDGRFLAAQQGQPPTWPTLLAQDAAVPPERSTLAIYRLTETSVQPGAAAPLGSPALLGRSADSGGFLVESPRPEGSRWLGRVEWETGALTWLVRSDDVNAHATFTAGGDLLYTRRRPGQPRAELVLHSLTVPETPDLVLSNTNESFHFPVCGDDPGVAIVLIAGERGLEAGVVPLPSPMDAGASLGVAVRVLLSPPTDAVTLYQVAAPLQTPIPIPGAGSAAIGGVPLFHPAQLAMGVLRVSEGRMDPLIPGSFAACPLRVEGNVRYLVSTPGGLVQSQPGVLRPQTVIAGQAVARATQRADRFVLIAPFPLSTGFAAEISLLGGIEPE